MKVRRNGNLLVEPPSAATGDIAFNLIVFFLVCLGPAGQRATAGDSAERKQQEKTEQSENIEVSLTRSGVQVTAEP